MSERLSSLVQVGISVSDVRATAAALSQLFAIDDWRFVSWSAEDHPTIKSSHRGHPNPEWKGELGFAKLGAIEIELIQDVAGVSTYRESVERAGFGIRHIMFEVTNLADAITLAGQHGISVSTQTSTVDDGVTWAVLDTASRFGFDVEVKMK